MKIRELMDNVNDLTTDDVLSLFGLQRRAGGQILSMIGLFGIGVAVGTGMGLLVAPKSGIDLRRELAGRARDLADRARDLSERGKTAAREAAERVRTGAGREHEEGAQEATWGEEEEGGAETSTT